MEFANTSRAPPELQQRAAEAKQPTRRCESKSLPYPRLRYRRYRSQAHAESFLACHIAIAAAMQGSATQNYLSTRQSLYFDRARGERVDWYLWGTEAFGNPR